MTAKVKISELPAGTPTSASIFPYVSLDEPPGGFDVTRQAAGTLLAGTHVHLAEDIPFTPTGTLASDTVQEALEELDTEKVAVTDYTAADVLLKLSQVDGVGSGLDADFFRGLETVDFAFAVHAHAAAEITVVPTGGITAETVQAALAALDQRLLTIEAKLLAHGW